MVSRLLAGPLPLLALSALSTPALAGGWTEPEPAVIVDVNGQEVALDTTSHATVVHALSEDQWELWIMGLGVDTTSRQLEGAFDRPERLSTCAEGDLGSGGYMALRSGGASEDPTRFRLVPDHPVVPITIEEHRRAKGLIGPKSGGSGDGGGPGDGKGGPPPPPGDGKGGTPPASGGPSSGASPAGAQGSGSAQGGPGDGKATPPPPPGDGKGGAPPTPSGEGKGARQASPGDGKGQPPTPPGDGSGGKPGQGGKGQQAKAPGQGSSAQAPPPTGQDGPTTEPPPASTSWTPGPDKASAVGAFVATCLPTGARAAGVNLQVRSRYRPWVGHRTETHTFDMDLRDTDLVELPDGQGTLILFSRYLRLSETRGKTVGATPDTSTGDIVAWWSPDGTFDDDEVRGPFLLVDGLKARPGFPYRTWLGVPGAAVVGKHLYVYYVSEAKDQPFLDTTKGYELGDFEGGMAVKAIKLSRLLDDIDSDDTFDPTDWTRGDAVKGKLLGAVRIWAAVRGGGNEREVVRLTAKAPGDNRLVDPEPVVCDQGLQLYSTLLPDGPITKLAGRYHGIWHAAAIPQGTVLNPRGGSLRATFGRDFIVAPLDDEGSADLLSPTPSERYPMSQVFLDPDAVQLPTGSWLVHAGSSDHSGLWRFEGEDAVACTSWEQAWER